jgi:hypothetical protein
MLAGEELDFLTLNWKFFPPICIVWSYFKNLIAFILTKVYMVINGERRNIKT